MEQYKQLYQYDKKVYLSEIDTSSIITYIKSIFSVFSLIKREKISLYKDIEQKKIKGGV